MSDPSGASDHQEDLLERLYGSRDLREALSLFFDAVLAPEGIRHAVILLPEGASLRGVSAMGWSDESIGCLSAPLSEADHPLIAALHSSQPSTIQRPPELAGGGPEELTALSLAPLDPGGPPLGLILMGPGSAGSGVTAPLLQRIGVVSGLLGRSAERDRLLRSGAPLEQQRDLLSTVVDALPDPVRITGGEKEIILENRRAEALFTALPDDSDGRRRAVEINNLLFSSFLTRFLVGGGDGSPIRELNLVDPGEGGDLLFEVLSTDLPPELCGDDARVFVLRDVTDLKSATTELEHQFTRIRQAEVKSRRERDRLNLILENVGDPILVTNEESNIILMNREAERLFDVPAGTGSRSRRRRDVHANDSMFSSLISDFALSPDATRTVQVTLKEPDTGNSFPAEVVSGKVLNERGEITAVVSILHDLTKVVENERLAAELGKLNENLEDRIRTATVELEERNRQLEWQREELERAYRLKSQFLASMSHELRTPINALLGYTSLMRDHIYGELNRRQEEALSRMYAASQHLLELVNDILDLAKIEAGKMPVTIDFVDIGMVIRELSRTIEPMVRRKHLEYVIGIDPKLPTVRTDPIKIKQVILNLLSNAAKFTHQGRVTITARRPESDDGILIEVADTGIGIRKSDLANIFEDFRQVDQSSTREYGGTGLGLSITKKLLHLLGGTIRVESTFGSGTTFTVWLPNEGQEVLVEREDT